MGDRMTEQELTLCRADHRWHGPHGHAWCLTCGLLAELTAVTRERDEWERKAEYAAAQYRRRNAEAHEVEQRGFARGVEVAAQLLESRADGPKRDLSCASTSLHYYAARIRQLAKPPEQKAAALQTDYPVPADSAGELTSVDSGTISIVDKEQQ